MSDHQSCDYLGAPDAPGGWQHAQAGRIADGCRVDCWLKLDRQRIELIRFEVFGSAEAVEMARWLAHWLQGGHREQVRDVSGLWLAETVGVSAEARTEALCIEDALRFAMNAAVQTKR